MDNQRRQVTDRADALRPDYQPDRVFISQKYETRKIISQNAALFKNDPLH